MAPSIAAAAAAAAFASVMLALSVSVALAEEGATAKCFPDSFLFGTATAAYQVEGGWQDAGRTPSIWDDFCRERSDTVACANVADDFFHRYKSDVQLMADMGLSSFRFSISWSRVMHWDAESKRMAPTPEGIAFYRSLLTELLASGMAPVVTLYHWDLPSELHSQLSPSGWLNREIISHFLQFAELMFAEFGALVPFWATFNEPWSFTTQGYGSGRRAPGMSHSATNEYLAAHHLLLAHAEAVARFRELRAAPNSPIHSDARISIVLNLDTAYPLDASSAADVAASERKMQFGLGWYLQPIVSGEYPAVMRAIAGDRLPTFSEEEATLLKGSYDLFMLNHYSSKVVTDCGGPSSRLPCAGLPLGWARDLGIDDSRIPEDSRPASLDAHGHPNCAWFSGYPAGYLATILWMSAHDPSADILLTENGWCGNDQVDNMDQLWYFQAYLEQVHAAMTEHAVPVIGYTAWSFVDNYEWGSYDPRFGLFYVNFTSETGSPDERTPPGSALQRVPRPAARWFAQLARSKCLTASATPTAAATDTGSPTFRLVEWVGGAVVVVAAVVLAALFARRWQRAELGGERSPLL